MNSKSDIEVLRIWSRMQARKTMPILFDLCPKISFICKSFRNSQKYITSSISNIKCLTDKWFLCNSFKCKCGRSTLYFIKTILRLLCFFRAFSAIFCKKTNGYLEISLLFFTFFLKFTEQNFVKLSLARCNDFT